MSKLINKMKALDELEDGTLDMIGKTIREVIDEEKEDSKNKLKKYDELKSFDTSLDNYNESTEKK